MGVSTRGLLSQDVKAIQVFDIIIKEFDNKAKFDIRTGRTGDSGYITFNYNGKDQQMFYCDNGVRDEEDEDKAYNSLSLNCDKDAVKIISTILKYFGGYLDENDCDEKDNVYIPKDQTFEIDKYISVRNKIIECLDLELSISIKMTIAGQILKHKKELLQVIN